MNWYKQAGMDLKFLSHDSYGNLRVLVNGRPYDFYDVSPFWANKIKWMIEKSKIPGEVIYNRHLKNFSNPERHKELNPEPPQTETPKKPQQGVFPFMEAGNWFGKFLYASIWDTDSDGSFEDNLKAMAELEYKLYAINTWPFSGMPQRQANIAQKLEEELWGVLEELKTPLENTFRSWLSAHALTNPSEWAAGRMDPYGMGAYDYIESMGEEAAITGVVDEYLRYKHNNQGGYPESIEQGFSEMLSSALQQPENFPSLQGLSDLYARDEEERYMNELSDEGFETFGENYVGQPFESEEAAEQWIEEQISNFDLSEHMYDTGMENFIYSLQYSGISLEQFLQELNQHIVFPMWMNYWGAMGIEGTRELAQEAYDRLENASNLQDTIVAINHAIDVNHQNGAMIEHMESYSGLDSVDTQSITNMMDEIASGSFVPEWNEELKQIGISVPKSTIPQTV